MTESKQIEDPLFRLMAAQQQVNNIISLIHGNEYEQYMNLKLTSVWYELDRQIKCLLTDSNQTDNIVV